jgi:thioesterase domain-containing protein
LHTLGGGGGGGVLRYQKLSQLLGEDQPSFGLVAPPEPFSKIELMAAHYIQVMRAVQPVGPYHLGGYCFGGVVAFEMAQQLHAMGQKVDLLALLDSTPANVNESELPIAKTLHLFTSFPKRLERLFDQNFDQIGDALKRKAKKIARNMLASAETKTAKNSSRSPALEDVIDMSHYPKGYKHYAETHWKALTEYWPKIYPGRVTLFQTTHSSASIRPELIWKNLSGGGLEVKRISGTHEKMLEEPSVQIVAAELKKSLESLHPDTLKACAA